MMNLLPGAALNIHRLYPVKCLGQQLSMVTESDPESSETIDNSLHASNLGKYKHSLEYT